MANNEKIDKRVWMFNGLADFEGKIVGLLCDPQDRGNAPYSELEAFDDETDTAKHIRKLEQVANVDYILQRPRQDFNEMRKARAAIQAEKLRRGVILDTPFVVHPDVEPVEIGKPDEPELG